MAREKTHNRETKCSYGLDGREKNPGVSIGKVEIFKVSAIPIYIMVIFSQ
jgi:hypothetical protein